MLRFVVRRLLLLVPILLGLSLLVFGWIRLLPGSPAQALLGERATPQTIAQIRHQLKLDRPLYEQYWGYLQTVGHLDFGVSISSRRTVTYEFAHRFPATVELALAAMFFAVAFGIPLAVVARITRAAVLDVQNEDYVRTARAKGLPPRIVDSRHVLRNALLPVSTIIGLQTGLLLSGAVLTETVFAWPGIGSWLKDAIFNRDYPVLQGGILFVAIVFVLVNLLVDISYAIINPRIRVS